MEAFPSVDTVLQALDALYHQPDAEAKHKASLWLTELQSSVRSLLILIRPGGQNYFKARITYTCWKANLPNVILAATP